MGATSDEQRGYSKGYAAGQRRVVREWSEALAKHRRDEFKRAVFLAILPELVARPWKTGDTPWKGMSEFVDGAWKFADMAARGTPFSADTFARLPSQPEEY